MNCFAEVIWRKTVDNKRYCSRLYPELLKNAKKRHLTQDAQCTSSINIGIVGRNPSGKNRISKKYPKMFGDSLRRDSVGDGFQGVYVAVQIKTNV